MRVMFGLIMGLFLGLSVGLLLAPSPGSETRHKLRERAEPTLERIRRRVKRDMAEEEEATAA